MPVPINYNPSTISQTRIVAPEFELQNPLYTEVAKPSPYFDPAKYLAADLKVQAPFVRPPAAYLDPLTAVGPMVGQDKTFKSAGVGDVTYNTGNIDSMQEAAEKLLSSDKQSDQQMGMLLMQRANQMFTLWVELHKMKHQQALSALQAINR